MAKNRIIERELPLN